jgi:hypothetical protein
MRRVRRKYPCRTVIGMEQHNPCTCQGCDEVLDLEILATWLHISTHTLYKVTSTTYNILCQRSSLASPLI